MRPKPTIATRKHTTHVAIIGESRLADLFQALLSTLGLLVDHGCKDALAHLYVSDSQVCREKTEVLAGFEEGVLPLARDYGAVVAAPPALRPQLDSLQARWVGFQLYFDMERCAASGWGNAPAFAKLLYRILANILMHGVCSYTVHPGSRVIRRGAFAWLSRL